ncbi:hypothetical protein HA466_0069200 [Hirschfeldia incana]|nr:hypothetical protein HA466_0069200 [Hirschfeldia incana]
MEFHMPNDDSLVMRTRGASPNHLNDRSSSDESRSFFNCLEKGTRNSFVSSRSLDALLSECTYNGGKRKTWNGFGCKTRANLVTSANTVKEQSFDDDGNSVYESHERQNCNESLTQVRRVSPYFQGATVSEQSKQGCNSDIVSSQPQSGSSTRSKAKAQRVSPFDDDGNSVCESLTQVRRVSPYFKGSTVSEQPRDLRQHFKVVKVSRYFHGLSADGIQVNESQKKEISRRVRKTPLKSPSLSKRQKTDEAYLRKTPDNTWAPPRSPCNLLQEDHWHDPWRVLVICMLLNKTSGAQVLSFPYPY